MNRDNNILLNYKSIKLCVLCDYFVVKLRSIFNKQTLRFSVFGLLTLFTLLSNAQVTVQTDTTRIRIGEQINLKYSVAKQENVQFPNKLVLDSLQKMEMVKSFDVDTIKNQLIKKYTLTSFDSGRYELPQQLILIKGKKHLTKSIIFDVSTVAVDTTKQKLFPIKAIQHQKLTIKDYAKNYWYLWLIIPLILGLIWWFFIRKKETEEDKIAKIPPFEIAVQQLEQLDGKLLWQNNKTKEYYSELTDILRTYIEKEFKIPALESTTNELINSLKKFNNKSGLDISKKTILKLKDLLKEADLVKFAKSKPFADEIQMHRTYADTILEGLKIKDEVLEEVIEENVIDDNNNLENQKKETEDDK